MTGHRQDPQRQRPDDRPRRRRQGHAQRRRQRRILYMNTCDQAQGWTTSHCQDQDHPQLTVQNLTFADGNSTGETDRGRRRRRDLRPRRPVQGGQLALRPTTAATAPARTSAARRSGCSASTTNLPVYVVSSTFGGGGGPCSNGGALSSIGVSWVVLNSVFSDNRAIGNGANPAAAGTPGGGSGGAIYMRRQHVHAADRRHRSSRTTTPTRAAARSSSSATTAPAR